MLGVVSVELEIHLLSHLVMLTYNSMFAECGHIPLQNGLHPSPEQGHEGVAGAGVAVLQVQSEVSKVCPGGQIGVWVDEAEIRVFRMRAQVKLKSWRNPRGGASRGCFVASWVYYGTKIGGVEFFLNNRPIKKTGSIL